MQNQTLTNIQDRIFGRKPKENDQIVRLCEIIEVLGGWQNFMETPIPVICEMSKMIDEKEKREHEKYKRMFGKK